MMMTIGRGLAIGAVFAGTALGLANPASAEPLSGMYKATATDSTGATVDATWILTPCGPDCLTLMWKTSVQQMHRQGSIWTSTDKNACVTTMDENTLTGTFACPDATDPPVTVHLTRA